MRRPQPAKQEGKSESGLASAHVSLSLSLSLSIIITNTIVIIHIYIYCRCRCGCMCICICICICIYLYAYMHKATSSIRTIEPALEPPATLKFLVSREWKNGSNSSYNCTPFLHSLLTKGKSSPDSRMGTLYYNPKP